MSTLIQTSLHTSAQPGASGTIPTALEQTFDLSNLRLSQDFSAASGAKQVLTRVPVGRAPKQEFVRVRPGAEWCLQTMLFELKEEGETYLVDRPLWFELGPELTAKVLFTAITRSGVLFLWTVRLPGEDGRIDPWNMSALQAAARAEDRWVRVQANRSLGAYSVTEASAIASEPQWPGATFQEILDVAFRDRFIKSLDHPVLRRLRGEV